MLDYEILRYQVEYTRRDETDIITKTFHQEEIALYFIKANHSKWSSFRLLSIQTAIFYDELLDELLED